MSKKFVFGNAHDGENLKVELTKVFEELSEILVQHSGPFAANCVIGSKWRQRNDVDEFTKDGILILRHLIVSEDVACRFAIRMARLVGVTVDSRCHDGTTTSMLTFCRLAIAAVEKLDLDINSSERFQYAHEFLKAMNAALSFLETIKITPGEILDRCLSFGLDVTEDDVRQALAYHMAMISSKGDHDLASKISQVVRWSPRKTYGVFRNAATGVETKEKFTLKKQDYDMSIDGNLYNLQDYNYKNDTQFYAKDAVVFASGGDICTDSMESAFLMAFISKNPMHRVNLSMFGMDKGWEDFHEGRRQLIIMAHMVDDHNLNSVIYAYNRENPNTKIVIITLQFPALMRGNFNKTIHYVSGCDVFADCQADAARSLIGLHRNVDVHLIGHVVTLKNLYDKDGRTLHPFGYDPTLFEPYTRFKAETEELIEYALKNVTNPGLDDNDLTYLISLYRVLTCQELYDIQLGGSLHDQYANRTVYEDAMGAALSAVEDGVVLGGYNHLAQYFHRKPEHLDDVVSCIITDELYSVILSSLRLDKSTMTAEEVVVVSEPHDSKWSYVVADKEIYLDTNRQEPYIKREVFDKDTAERFLKLQPGRPVLFQPYTGFEEQFNRFADILPKLANTAHLADMRVTHDTDLN